MNLRVLASVIGVTLVPCIVEAQAPRYHAEFLGTFFPGRISDRGEIIGTTTIGGNQRGYLVRPGNPLELLPLPDGMISSYAIDINERGVIVGAVSSFYSPEFGGRAVAWDPDQAGGYTPRFLGALPGQALSRAMAVNNLGDIVGYSSDSTYRYPVLFTAPGGVMDLTSTGVFDPVDINDQRVLVDHSFTVKRLDLDTMVLEDLGVPPGNYLATTAAAINAAGQVAGNAILTTSTSCDRVAARYTDGVGWQIFSGCGPYNGVSDMNEQGDVIMRLNLAPYVRFEGLGTFLVEDLILHDVGHWYVSNTLGMTINSAKSIVVFASNQVTGQSGALLLTPEGTAEVSLPGTGSPASAIDVTAGPNPFDRMTSIRYDLPGEARVSLIALDVTGRVVRRFIDGETQTAGPHRIDWNGGDESGRPLASGAYRIRLDTGGVARTRSVVLLR